MTRHSTIQRLRMLSLSMNASRLGFKSGNYASVASETAALVAAHLGQDNGLAVTLRELARDAGSARGFAFEDLGPQIAGAIEAAMTVLQDEPAPSPTVDSELWADLGVLVETKQWHIIPGRVATFVESWIRDHSGNPKNHKGGKLYGAGLMFDVLNPDGALALGEDQSEREGWRDLAVGLAKAIGNDHRHSVSARADAETVAWGAIGLGSLILTEFKCARALAAGKSESV